VKTILAIAIAALTLAAQEFEVVSIRPSVPDNSRNINTDKGFFRTHNAQVKRLIANAYDIDIGQIFGGPPWLESEGFDINAKIPEEFAQRTRQTVPQMIQNMLAGQFKLVIHREPRQVSGYILVVAKSGPKMEPAKTDQKGSGMSTNNTHMKATNTSMETLARHLSNDTGKLVVDRTGLTSRYDFELDWAPDRVQSSPEASTDTRPSIFTALQEQLGLKLESAKVTVSAIVIDRIEKPESN
jgi:uncharacterized protein (TIGR03435 family)